MCLKKGLYKFGEIEKKWQGYWQEHKTFKAEDCDRSRSKYYVLDMFPYPRGQGLHVGHPEGYTASDIVSRYKRMRGFNVLHPMGWDAFGLPAEQYAVKTGTHPAETTKKNIDNMRRQIKSLGFSYDWDREVNTTDPNYYKWTQWIFLKLFNSYYDQAEQKAKPIEHLPIPEGLNDRQKQRYIDDNRLAYEAEVAVNWCPELGTVLANEEVIGGLSERGGHPVIRKPMRQWMLRITKYAERLIDDIAHVDWSESIKKLQTDWVGKSIGAEVDFKVAGFDEVIRVFTTRPDTLFGATYMVMAPEHALVDVIATEENKPAIEDYRQQAARKSDLDRTDLAKEKSGVFTGAYAINPVNDEKIPIWISDYVLISYGTGAIMAVPAHDDRDFEFAKTFDLPIIPVIGPSAEYDCVSNNLTLLEQTIEYMEKEAITYAVICGYARDAHSGVVHENHSDVDIAVEKSGLDKTYKFLESIGLRRADVVGLGGGRNARSFFDDKMPRWIDVVDFEIVEGKVIDNWHNETFEWGSCSEVFERRKLGEFELTVASLPVLNIISSRVGQKPSIVLPYVEAGVNINSANDEISINGLPTDQAKEKITDWLEEISQGKKAVNYKLRDWLFSRQRYWGEPFPIVHTEDGNIIGLSEQDLPVTLPKVKNYKPTGQAEPPLANASDWVNVELPDGTKAKRETNTMPQWAGSCWYYLRYIDPDNDQAAWDPEKEKYWMNVDLYIGGAEHAVLHLLYARFWHKFLYDLGYVSTKEPFGKLINQGMILGGDGQKMSKSRGNVVNPDKVIADYGADSMRLYEMFMGPLEAAKPWNMQGVEGVYRFLQKAWRMTVDDESGELSVALQDTDGDEATLRLLNQTIKKVGSDIETFSFNTAISAMMIFVNHLGKQKVRPRSAIEKFALILAPFAPHIAEELWQKLGHTNTLAYEPWPGYDAELVKEKEVELAVQVLGKIKDRIVVAADADEEQIRQKALASEKVIAAMADREPKKVIVIKSRLVNIIV